MISGWHDASHISDPSSAVFISLCLHCVPYYWQLDQDSPRFVDFETLVSCLFCILFIVFFPVINGDMNAFGIKLGACRKNEKYVYVSDDYCKDCSHLKLVVCTKLCKFFFLIIAQGHAEMWRLLPVNKDEKDIQDSWSDDTNEDFLSWCLFYIKKSYMKYFWLFFWSVFYCKAI